MFEIKIKNILNHLLELENSFNKELKFHKLQLIMKLKCYVVKVRIKKVTSGNQGDTDFSKHRRTINERRFQYFIFLN